MAERPIPKPDVVAATADLRPNQVQDLAEQMAELIKATAGHGLRFHLRIELGGASRPPDAVIANVNALLREISDTLTLQ